MKTRFDFVMLVALAVATSACAGSPLGSLGDRSSEWINEPTVPPTQPKPVFVPQPVRVEDLDWSNDDIATFSTESQDELLAAVFERRDGDRFIQASRFEIAIALPAVQFPRELPPGARWVSSQLVFNNDGSLEDDPSAAFGVWSAEPYTRSRSVAQMAVLRVSGDPEGAVTASDASLDNCARFADETTRRCVFLELDGLKTWLLDAAGGSTLVWFESAYRYELFGRSWVSTEDLRTMRQNMTPLAAIAAEGS